ncbi:MAG: Na(+)/H(+) antiporter subunit B [Candidatus Margulisbacteria bacterium]|nr:Na(+)/H(+) antiporter subunit B [Candidatus Margulisiibacteriota bacterium]
MLKEFKVLAFLVVLVTGAVLVYAIGDFPDWGDPISPASEHVSSYYIENAIHDTAVPNIVTALLADYRGFDTMFETVVVFVAGIAVLFMLRRPKRESEVSMDVSGSPIVKTATRIMVPMMQLFALYIVAHGHHSPGGGFQGGVILGASLILMAIAFGLPSALKKISNKATVMLSALGVLIFSGIGILCMFLGGNFLDYSVLSAILPGTDRVMARSHAMLGVEIGVALTVMTAMFSIYADLASEGQLDQGL